ncbi:stalk domain-containing protein [Paenibacillus sp. L3-i20]|uniref:stalk domain-containing protein n=1 Tax=Paenibacillus sp. L3-i20 TaxID=2905833 RepID=UPI001EDCC587|nr:hypothetical protein [Paenibacillus sp. L3-i20]GKU76840.1 hypothetical protein L3i20_v212370 [Paenibacillus sp. L3-i20]
MKKVIIGFLAGVIFATAGTALAAPTISKITASLRTDYKVELDGSKVELKNSPLAYNGSSYLPVKEMAELIGKEVSFDKGTIKLTTKEENPVDGHPTTNKNIGSQSDYDIKLKKLSDEKSSLSIGIETFRVLKKDSVDEKAIKKFEELIVEYNGKIESIDKQITELKEKYPEYAK